jgi:hypothetical protein
MCVGGILTRVMISEVLFGYFLFEEKVTDATALYQVASHSPELPIFSFDMTIPVFIL